MSRASTRRTAATNGNERRLVEVVAHEQSDALSSRKYGDDELRAAGALLGFGAGANGVKSVLQNNVNGMVPASTSTSAKVGRKRKRVMSVSVAAVARGQTDGAGTSEEQEREKEREQLSEPPTQTKTQSQAESKASSHPQQTRRHAETEATVNGTTVYEHRKSTPRNFDKVNFGQWQIKTWYYSPYPRANTEEDDMSNAAGPSRHGGVSVGTRSQHTKRGGVRGRGRVPDVRASNEDSTLWVCDRCFKYMREGTMLELHSKSCHALHPPGKPVYKRGGHIIWEIDGAKEKLYCQNLSLFGKLFIDIKTLFFDCENFMFYLLTEADRQQDHVLGFFSKEKVSYDGYNLACIVTFPPYQRKRYGMLMIEFSYELSRRAGKLGTPERPLSELGLRSYLTYWIGALVEFFRRVLSVRPSIDTRSQINQESIDDDLIRFVASQQTIGNPRKRRKSISNAEVWEGVENMYHSKDVVAATSGSNDVLFSRMRWTRTTANQDGSATTHIFARCTLEDISNATGLRIEDVAFALHECGLLQRIRALDSEEMEEVIVISREMVEQVAKEFNVKRMVMEVESVLV